MGAFFLHFQDILCGRRRTSFPVITMLFRFFANAVIMVVVIGLHTYALVTPICVPLRSADPKLDCGPLQHPLGLLMVLLMA
jgi:hypothetical protein